jgi:hypothetical protein
MADLLPRGCTPPVDCVNVLVSIARLEEQIKAVNEKLDQAVVSRAHLDERLAPLTENMNKWKGGVAAITIVAGSVGAFVSTLVKQWFLSGSSP